MRDRRRGVTLPTGVARLWGDDHRRGILSLVGLTAIFGLFGVLIRVLDQAGLTTLQQVYLRCWIGFATAVLVFGGVPRAKLRAIGWREWLLLVFRGIGGFLLASVLFSMAVTRTTLGNAALISSLPVVAVLALVFAPRSLRAWQVVGTLAALLGAVIIAADDVGNPFSWGVGDGLALLSVLAISLVFLGRKWHSDLLTNSELTRLTLLCGAVATLAASLLAGDGGFGAVRWTPGVVAALIAAGSLLTANSLLANFGFQHLGNVLAGNLLVLEAAFGLAFGFLFYGEALSVRGLVGAVVIVGGVLLVNSQERRPAAGVPVGEPPAVTAAPALD